MCEPLTKAPPAVDWSKPVRFAGGQQSVRVLAAHNGRAFVTWGTEDSALVAESDGYVACGFRIEHVPEEPKDHIRLYSWDGGPWRVFADPLGSHNAALLTRTEAEADAADYNEDPRGRSIAVKVPA